MTGGVYKRGYGGSGTESCRGRRPCDGGGRGWVDAATAKDTKDCWPPLAAGRGEGVPSPKPSVRTGPVDTSSSGSGCRE